MRNFFKHITKIGLLTGSLFLMGNAFSQCANNNVFWQNAGTPAAGTTTTVTGTWGGEYITVGVVNGSVYTFSTCGGGTWDSQLTLYNNSGGAALGYNDDFCGVQSQITWTATFTGTLRVLLDQYSCASNTSPMTITITRAAPGGYNPCSSISTLSCGVSTSANNTAGNGAWNSYGGPFSVPGRERIFQFTPTITGIHSITVSSSSGYLDLFYKTASGCNSTGWTYVDDIIGTATNNVTFTAGTTYYIMLDDEDINATTASITIGCPSPAIYNPCTSIGSLSCGVTTSVLNPAGNGAWSSFGGPFTTPGTEKLYTFTAPYTGPYSIAVNHSSSGYVDLFYKQSASGCNNSGWTYVDDILTTATNTVTLTGGVTYYIMLDDEDVSGSNSTINITCPPPPCVGSTLDGSYTYSAPFVIGGNTTGACNNSTLRLSQDLTYAVAIGCAGNYTFSLCGGAAWDTYLYLTTAAGGGTIIASNDDACSLQSSVSAFLNPGTYYISVEGFSETSSGAFTLSVSGSGSAPNITGSSANVSCFGGNNGSVTASINGNGNTATATLNGSSFSGSATGLTAGSYTLVATNCWGSTSQIFIVDQPSALSASSTSGSILCNGGTTTVTVSGLGGTAPYSGTGTFTVGAGNYNYTITDANGCTAVTSITVSQPSALSASSTSGSILCNGGTTTVTVSGLGGTAPYSGTGTFTVGAGNYNYTITDANGCTAVTSISVSEPTLLTSSASAGSILCNGGTTTVSVSASGGTAPYTGTGSYTVGAGTHTFTVMDANDCSSTVVISVSEPTLLVASSSAGSIACNGGTATVTVSGSGGTAPYIGTGTFTVGAGSYSYTVTDANGCSAVTTINITEPSVLTLLASPSFFDCGYGVSCNGSTDGFVLLSANGGTPIYTYSGSATAALGAGTYNYVVTDANGCVAAASATLTEPAPMSINLVTSDYNGYGVSCNGSDNGTVVANVAGGCATYTYDWNNGANTSGITNLTAGNYVLTVVDANGCSISASANLTQPDALIADAGNNALVYAAYPPLSCTDLTATVTGGVSSYTYTWSNGAITPSINVCPISNTTYTVTVTDQNGCTATDDVMVCSADITCTTNGGSGNEASFNALSRRANIRVSICHHTGHGDQTMCLPISAIADHLAHGDVLGECGANYSCDGIERTMEIQEPIEDFITMDVFPNPTASNTNFNIRIVSGSDKTGSIEMMDISGKVVRNFGLIELKQGELHTIEVNNNNIKAGIYIIRLITDKGEVQSFRLVQN